MNKGTAVLVKCHYGDSAATFSTSNKYAGSRGWEAIQDGHFLEQRPGGTGWATLFLRAQKILGVRASNGCLACAEKRNALVLRLERHPA